jgi:hypothetical protein
MRRQQLPATGQIAITTAADRQAKTGALSDGLDLILHVRCLFLDHKNPIHLAQKIDDLPLGQGEKGPQAQDAEGRPAAVSQDVGQFVECVASGKDALGALSFLTV